jgi:hypothetical protein
MSAVEAATAQVDPVPRPPFPSHRSRGAGLVGGVKSVIAIVLRPFTRFLFQRQAELNRETVRTSALLAAHVRVLAEAAGRQSEQVEAWSHDLRRSREERLLVLDTLLAMAGDLRALREGAPAGPDTAERLRRLEQKVEDLSRGLAGPARP